MSDDELNSVGKKISAIYDLLDDKPFLGWVNIYPGDNASIRIAHRTREDADRVATPERVRCVRVVEVPVEKPSDRPPSICCPQCGSSVELVGEACNYPCERCGVLWCWSSKEVDK